MDDWPDCPVTGCTNKICLALNSDKCFVHTEGNELEKRLKIDARNAVDWSPENEWLFLNGVMKVEPMTREEFNRKYGTSDMLTPFDPAPHIETAEDALDYLEAAMEGDDREHIASALIDIARSRWIAGLEVK